MGGRTAAIIAALIATLLLGLPVGTGFLLERAFPWLIETINQRAAGVYRVEGRIQRGFWTSSAETTLFFAGTPELPGPALPLHHEIAHGPIPMGEIFFGRSPLGLVLAVLETTLPADASRVLGVTPSRDGRPLVRLLTRFYLDQSAWAEIDSPDFISEAGGLTSRGVTGDLDFRTAGQGIHLRLEAEAIGVSDGTRLAAVDGLDLNVHVYAVADGFEYDGVVDFGPVGLESPDVASATLGPSQLGFSGRQEADTENEMTLELLAGDFEVAEKEGEAGTPLRLRGGKAWLEANWIPMGPARARTVLGLASLESPQRSWQDLSIRAATRNLDLGAIRRLLDELAQLDLVAPELLDGDIEAARTALFIGRLPEICALSPELELTRAEWATPGGKLSAEGFLAVDGRDPAAFATAFEALVAARGRFDLQIPVEIFELWMDLYLVEAVAEEAGALPRAQLLEMAGFLRQMALMRLLDEGFLLREEDHYLIEARLEQGLPVINGKLLGAKAMMGILSGS
jgi:hypothetical protein